MKKIALFYILNKAEDLKISACKIIKEYYKKKYKIFVSSHSNDLVNELNNLLWTFEQISFIPHCTTKNYDKNSPILLSGKDSFPKTINLKELSLEINNIKKIEGLDNLVNLQTLDLHNNYIKKIEGLFLNHPRHVAVLLTAFYVFVIRLIYFDL